MGSETDYLERSSCVAVFGGTFDPIHNGHLSVATAVLHQFKPQRVVFIPAGRPPHKPGKIITCAQHRYQMLLHSIARVPGLDVSRMEINRPGPSYTIDTIKTLKETCPKDCLIYFIVGQDALQNIESWKDYKDLFKLCEFIAVPRPGYKPEEFASEIKQIQKKYKVKIHKLKTHKLDISGTFIRTHFAQNSVTSALMPREAEDYARKNGLYNFVLPNLSDEHFEWAKSCLEARLSPKRFTHSLGVVIEAEKLAVHYGANVHKARWAALLHDCAKEYGAEKKRMLCKQWEIETDEVIDAHIDLAHGLLAAECARRDFYVTDDEILQAIRFHILGHKNMNLLDKIIVLADFIEPYRDYYYPLHEMRSLAYVDINKALVLGLEIMRDLDAERGKTLHYWSQDAIKTLGG